VAPLESSADWLEDYRQLVESRLDRFGEHLQKIQREQKEEES
jgi:hypothetical protein